MLVMVIVKTKCQLRPKYNDSLACLATTDLVVGLVVQPFQIVHHGFILKGESSIFCSTFTTIRKAITITSLNISVLLTAERYIAIYKTPRFGYDNLVTEVRTNRVRTKPGVGHGLGHGVGHGVGHGLPVVNKVKK